MMRRMIQIDEERCNGCGLCVQACHEGAIGMVEGKARLLRDDYCDGLGDCLPTCPTGAIAFVEREAAAYDQQAVLKNKARQEESLPGACPGSLACVLHPACGETAPVAAGSELKQWPVQIKLMPVQAPYFDEADLLVAADCAAYAYGNFHHRFMRNRITVVGCPKLDGVDYAEKLTDILQRNHIRSITVVRMEVPCCTGLEHAVGTALQQCGKQIPWQVEVISTDGQILD